MSVFLLAALSTALAGPPSALLGTPAAAAAQATESCQALKQQTAGPTSVKPRKLGDLPPAMLEHAVMRTVGGCPVREIVDKGQVRYVPTAPVAAPIEPLAAR